MCRFLSAVVLQKGLKIICDPSSTDSHSDLLQAHWLADDEQSLIREKFARVEFVPPKDHKNITDLSTWELVLDEQRTVSWWDACKDEVRDKLENLVRQHIVTDEQSLLLGDWWILAGQAKVEKAQNAVIKVMTDKSNVREMYGSSNVGCMLDSSSVEYMHDSSSVREMHDSSSVEYMYDSSRVGWMWGSSSVEYMFDSSSVEIMQDSSSVEIMHDSSSVRRMYGSSNVRCMYDSSSVRRMYGSSSVGNMCDSSNVEYMWGSNAAPRAPGKDYRES